MQPCFVSSSLTSNPLKSDQPLSTHRSPSSGNRASLQTPCTVHRSNQPTPVFSPAPKGPPTGPRTYIQDGGINPKPKIQASCCGNWQLETAAPALETSLDSLRLRSDVISSMKIISFSDPIFPLEASHGVEGGPAGPFVGSSIELLSHIIY